MKRTYTLLASSLALVAMQGCKVTELNGTLTLNENADIQINDVSGGTVKLGSGSTDATLDNKKHQIQLRSGTSTVTVQVPEKYKDLRKPVTIPGVGTSDGQPVSISTNYMPNYQVTPHESQGLERCYTRLGYKRRYDPGACRIGDLGNGWRGTGWATYNMCTPGTRSVTYYSTTKTHKYTFNFLRGSDTKPAAEYVAFKTDTQYEGSVNNEYYCKPDHPRYSPGFYDFDGWQTCDFRCDREYITPPRPVNPSPNRPRPVNSNLGSSNSNTVFSIEFSFPAPVPADLSGAELPPPPAQE